MLQVKRSSMHVRNPLHSRSRTLYAWLSGHAPIITFWKG